MLASYVSELAFVSVSPPIQTLRNYDDCFYIDKQLNMNKLLAPDIVSGGILVVHEALVLER